MAQRGQDRQELVAQREQDKKEREEREVAEAARREQDKKERVAELEHVAKAAAAAGWKRLDSRA